MDSETDFLIANAALNLIACPKTFSKLFAKINILNRIGLISLFIGILLRNQRLKIIQYIKKYSRLASGK